MAKNDSIRVSPKHGVNPCIPICIYCGKEKNEVALLGELPNDEKAPINAVINDEPCDNCIKQFQKAVEDGGILVFEGTEQIIKNKTYRTRTGRMFAIKEEAFENIFKDALKEEMYNNILNSKERAFTIEQDLFEHIFKEFLNPTTE